MDNHTERFISCARDTIRELVPLVLAAAGAPSAQISVKRDGSLVTSTDTFVEKELTQAFSGLLPGIPILGEEGAIDDSRISASTATEVYGAFFQAPLQIVVDPIDGTRNFVAGRNFYCIAAALTRSVGTGIWPVASVVAIPAEQMLLWSDGQTVFCENLVSGEIAPVVRSETNPPAISVNSRDRAWLAAERFNLNLPWVSSGSSVYDLIECARGRLRGSVVGSQRLWDLMAPLGIACSLSMALRDIRGGEEIACIDESCLSRDIIARPWGLDRRMVLLPRGVQLHQLLAQC